MANEVNIIIRSKDQSKQGLDSARSGMDEVGNASRRMGRDIDASRSSFDGLDTTSGNTGSKLRSTGSDMDDMSSKTRSTGEAAHKAGVDIDDMGSKSERAGSKMSTLKGGVANLGSALSGMAFTAGAAAAALGGVAAVKLGQSIGAWTQQAVDARETYSKAMTVFEDGYYAVLDWAGNAADSLGISEIAALDAASEFQDLFSQLKFGRKEAQDMSTDLVQLAVDLGSFKNADASEVIENMNAAFIGEYDSMQKYVKTISAANVQNKALEMTGKATTKQLTDKEKAAATLAYMMENAGDAVGDFARTSDSAANQQKIAEAHWKDSTEAIGHRFVPVLEYVTKAKKKLADVLLSKLVPALDRALDWWYENEDVIKSYAKEAAGKVQPVLETIGEILEDTLIPAWQDIARAIGDMMKHEDTIKGLAFIVGGVLGAAFVSVAATITTAMGVVLAFLAVVRGIVAVVQGVAGAVTAAWGWISEKTAEVWGFVSETVTMIWQTISDTIGTVIGFIQGIIQAGIDIILAIWKTIEEPVMAVWNLIAAMIGLQMAIIQAIIEIGIGIILGIWDTIKGPIEEVWNFIEDTISTILDAINEVVQTHVDAILVVWDTIKGPIEEVWNFIEDTVSEAMGWIKDKVTEKTGEAQKPFWEVYDTVYDVYREIKNVVEEAMTWVYNKTIGVVNEVTGFINGLKEKISGISVSGVRSKVSGLFKASGGPAGGATWVGEHGPELVRLPHGSAVMSNSTSQALMHQSRFSSGGGGSVTFNVYGSILSDKDIERIVLDAFRNGGFRGVTP